MNRAILGGTISSYGVRLSYTQASKPFLTFALTLTEGDFKTYVPIQIVGPQAEVLAESLEPGDYCLLEGKLSWKKEQSKLQVVAFGVERLSTAGTTERDGAPESGIVAWIKSKSTTRLLSPFLGTKPGNGRPQRISSESGDQAVYYRRTEMTVKRKSPWRPHRPSDAADLKPPRYLPGDPVILDGGTSARVEYARSDGMCCLTLPSGKHEWVHEDVLQFAPGFAPVRRR